MELLLNEHKNYNVKYNYDKIIHTGYLKHVFNDFTYGHM